MGNRSPAPADSLTTERNVMDMKQIQWNRHRTQPYGIAAVSAVVCGVITHLYALVNNLHNYDNIAVQPGGFGAGVTSGRWMLSILGSIADYLNMDYNLPLVNGLMFLLLLGVTAGFLADILELRRRSSAILAGMMLAVFPTAVSTMFFRYTAVYYGIGILLSVFAVWVLPRSKFGFLLSVLCTACSMGIYQAYVPITIGLLVMLMIRKTLTGDAGLKSLIRTGLYYCAAILAGVIVYYGLLRFSLLLVGKNLTAYQGINSMGRTSLKQLLYLAKEAMHYAIIFPIRDCYGLNTMYTTKFAYVLLSGVSIGLMIYLLITRAKKWSLACFAGLLYLAFALAVNFIVVMCPNTYIYAIMAYSFVLISCFPLMLLECLPERDFQKAPRIPGVLRKVCTFCLSLLVFSYAYNANVNYTGMYYANRQAESYCATLVAQIHMTEGFTSDQKWAFLGTTEDPQLYSPWESQIFYGGMSSARELIKGYSFPDWIRYYAGRSPTYLSAEECDALAQTAQVKAMPCYPDYGSIQIINDTVVVKFQELSPDAVSE